MIELPPKTPGDIVDYPIDFSLLLASGEAIDTVVSIVTEAGLTEDSNTLASPVLSITFSGGTEGETYSVVVTVSTDAGRTFERYFCLPVEAF